MRTGVIAKKVGMTCVYDDVGVRIPVTVLCIHDCQVTARKTIEKDGYLALQLGSHDYPMRKLSRPMQGFFIKQKIAPRQHLAEFRVSADNLLDVGTSIAADHFSAGQYVDVSGTSIGKGFAGPMKRWNFSGICASHGASISHRSHGSTGHRQKPSKVFKGKKMAGHLGSRRVTVQNLRVVRTDPLRNLVLVKGAVPGHKGAIVLLFDSIKKQSTSDRN